LERLNKVFASSWFLPALVAIAAFLWFFPKAVLPSAALDPSWTMAAEHAAHHGSFFGRDFVFSYGPFAVLSTRLYEPATFGFVIFYNLLFTALFLVPLLWSRRPAILFLYACAILIASGNEYSIDARVQVALLTAFLLAVRSRSLVPVALVVVLAPLFLSKLSYFFGALPLLLIADSYRLIRFRSVPLLTVATLAAMVVAMVATGHPLNLLPELAGNDLGLIAGYGPAMQYAWLGIWPLLAALVALAAIVPALAWLLWQRVGREADQYDWLLAGALVLGIGWHLFFSFKTGHVRQDMHIMNTWFGFGLAIPVLLAFFDEARPLSRLQIWLFVGLMGGSLLPPFVFQAAPYDLAYPGVRIRELARQPVDALSWLNPWTWRETADKRAEVERQLALRVPAGLSGTADVIPFELGPVIASSQVQYDPRPVPQTYSSYTPELQAMDARHFANPATAPDVLFLKIQEIDERVPTMGIGPTLPVLAAWYDAEGGSALGLVLRHRDQPRQVAEGRAVSSRLTVGDWVQLPGQQASPIIARMSLPQPAWSKLVGLIGREPLIHLELQFDDGSRRTFRFVPGMAEAGFVISPLPRSLDPCDFRGTAAMLDPAFAPDALMRVTALRIAPTGLIRHGYGPGTVTFSPLSIEGGFADGFARSEPQQTGPGQECKSKPE